MDDPTIWAVIWLSTMAAFGIGEMTMPGSFFLLPFAVGALAAAIVSLLSAPVVVGFAVFIAVSVGTFLGFRPLAKRLDATTPDVAGIGSNRLVGAVGTVTQTISHQPGVAGMVQVGTEEWKAEASLPEVGLPAGTKIRVVEIKGTRLVVEPAEMAGFQELT